MSDSVATSKRQRVADPLREYAEMLRKYHGTDVHGKEREYVTVTTAEMLKLADEIDRELAHVRKAEYARGYTDGQHSMDAEHYAVAIRLMRLPLDEDSHGNLDQIAGAIWYSDFGWTQGACRGLRDELVRLLGGVHDEHLPNICRTSGEPDENGVICETEPSSTGRILEMSREHESGCITDELRKWTGIDVWSCKWEEFNAIADRIDEQFERICEQQEAVLQATIEDAVKEREELQAKLDAIREVLDGR